jgi:peptidoglycan/xylan/chitin deacetylase (PgdA/CDA1 family)
MMYLPRVATAAEAEWPDLVVELDRWEETGRVARLWCRDDDAVAPTPELDRLLRLIGDAPLALAVIPQGATQELADRLAGDTTVAVLQHGWSHANHAAHGKRTEYPADRSAAEIAIELAAGRARLTSLFGARALPVLVPPWNRFAERFVPLLAGAGIIALSQQAPRKTALPQIATIDVHLDVTAWRGGRGFVGVGVALQRLIAELRTRRETGSETAIGVLMHHLVMDRATEDFLVRLCETVARHNAARWYGVRELLAP